MIRAGLSGLNSEFELEYISNTTNFIELKNGYDFTDSKAENYMLKGSVKKFVSLEENDSFLVRITI